MKKFIGIFVILLLAAAAGARAQSAETRRAFEKGVAAAAAGRFAAALGDFRAAAALADAAETGDDFRARIHFNIGVCLYRTGAAARSTAEFERALALAGGRYERAFYALGMARAELGDYPAAETAFRGALALAPRNGETWFDLAFVHLARRDFAAARTAFANAVRYGSRAAAAGHNNLGVLNALAGDLAAAISEFEAALSESNGKFTLAARNLEFCRSLGRDPRALTARLEFGEQE